MVRKTSTGAAKEMLESNPCLLKPDSISIAAYEMSVVRELPRTSNTSCVGYSTPAVRNDDQWPQGCSEPKDRYNMLAISKIIQDSVHVQEKDRQHRNKN